MKFCIGSCASNAKSIEYLISKPPESPDTGKIIALAVGGTHETMEARPGVYYTIANKRKGFVKLALKHG